MTWESRLGSSPLFMAALDLRRVSWLLKEYLGCAVWITNSWDISEYKSKSWARHLSLISGAAPPETLLEVVVVVVVVPFLELGVGGEDDPTSNSKRDIDLLKLGSSGSAMVTCFEADFGTWKIIRKALREFLIYILGIHQSLGILWGISWKIESNIGISGYFHNNSQ